MNTLTFKQRKEILAAIDFESNQDGATDIRRVVQATGYTLAEVEDVVSRVGFQRLDMKCIPHDDAHTEECIKGTNPCDAPYPVKLWASGGCTGYSDYLMSDGSIQTLKYSEPWAGSINP